MEQQSSRGKSVRFGRFDLDLRSGELRKDGLKVRLPHQSFQVLAHLLEHPGEPVSREQLRERLWANGTFVDFEVGLSSAVKKLRDALGDSAEDSRFIETLPRFGYRFIAPVDGSADGVGTNTRAAPPLVATAPPTLASVTPEDRRSLIVRAFGSALVVLGVLMTLAFLSPRLRDRLLGLTRPSAIRSIAVLPLENLSGDPSQDYFADGLTDAIITRLGETLGETTDPRVISRSSTSGYKATKTPLRVVGRELGADGIVEGSFVRSGGLVRVNIRLIDTRNEQLLLADSYERGIDDIIALQEDIARSIAQAITTKVVPEQQARLTRLRPVSAEANELLFRANAAAGRGSYQDLLEAIRYAESAVAKQPDFAMAYVAKAASYVNLAFVSPLAPQDFMPKAETAARKALALDDSIPEAHAALGLVLYRFRWDWRGAEREFRTAVKLNRSSVQAHRVLGVFLSLSGHPEEGVLETQRARDLDPISFQALLNLAIAHRAAGQNEQAIAEFRKILQDHGNVPRVHLHLGVSYLTKGDVDSAITEFQAAVSLARLPAHLSYLGFAQARRANRTEPQKILNELNAASQEQFVSPVDIAGLQAGLSDKEAAFASLEKACDVQDPLVTTLLVDRRMDSLRSDSRFQSLLRRVGLAE